MGLRNPALAGCAVALAGLLLSQGTDSAALARDRLQRHRNLGKAFYENPTGAPLAVEEFRKALELAPKSAVDRLNYGLALLRANQLKEGVAELERAQQTDPSIAHSWFNLGIQYKRHGRFADAIRQLEEFLRRVPEEPVAHYNLGVLYQLTDQPAEALKQFRLANQLNPLLVAPYFQIYNAYRLGEDEVLAARALAAFQEAKDRQKESGESEDMEWNAWAEILDIPETPPAPEAPPAELRFEERALPGRVDAATAGLAVMDADGDGKPDLLAWSREGMRLFSGGTAPALKGVISAAPGDFDNDGLADLCILTEDGPALYRNEKGSFRRAAAQLPAGRFTKAVWIDYDHDYDLDLVLLGPRTALVRNQGEGGFADRTASFPFVPGDAMDGAAYRAAADERSMDLLVTYADRPGVFYRDQMRGNYKAEPLPALPAGSRISAAFDINQDGFTDIAFAGPRGAGVILDRKTASHTVSKAASVVLADLENRGAFDLVLDGVVYRNQGGGRRLFDGVAEVAADFDGDGRTDLAGVSPDGVVHLLLNRTASKNQWLRVSLEGVKNPKLAHGAEIEIKAGIAYQKRLYEAPGVVFGLGGYREADAVRITWPNGTIQNETRRPAGRADAFKEAPRLAGSCPMVFTWNGRAMQFITDVLGVAPLGASADETGYFPLDHDEYVHIPPGALVPREGRYEVRITEELREVSYLDLVQLVAVDHPASTEIFTNDKFKSPPFPEFRLFGVKRRISPVRAADHKGRDVLAQVLKKDRAYPRSFRRDYAGVAELHHLALDFGPAAARDNRAILVLSGWVDWADGSTFLAAAQAPGGGLIMPYLQVKDSSGAWKTVIEDMGMPAGKPKTIVVDLTGKFLSASREIRIVTNLCVYWDEIFLSEDTAPPAVRQTTLDAAAAALRFRGFSRPIVHPRREQPEEFDYARVSPVSNWNPTPGLYTRYGEVRELLTEVDDRFVILGSGDELRLSFEAAALPPLPAGWSRDFLLRVDGWSKDGDANTAHSGAVEPLPFHGMSGYPYPASERFPETELHRAYRKTYNYRPALRLLRPLTVAAQKRVVTSDLVSVLAPVYEGGRFPQGASLSIATPGLIAAADPDVSFDGQRVLFAGKRLKGDPWQIFEMPLVGGAPRQVTKTAEDCIRPLYLPGDEFVYARKHGGSFQIESSHFAGGEPNRLTWAPGDFLPNQVLRDGRILFQGPHPVSGADLYTMYSDGSGVASLRCDHGPARREGRQLANQDIVFVSGRGLGRITPALARAVEVRAPAGEIAGPVAEVRPGEWLISLKPPGGEYFQLHRWLPDSPGPPALISRSQVNVVQPAPAAPRPTPLIHPSGLHGKPGANLLCLNAYESPLEIAQGAVASVRVYSQDAKGAAIRLGEAPVESDGSFYLHLPTERPIRLELAGPQGQVLAAEKGWFWMRHGEQRVCVGCHAGPERAPENAVPKVLQKSTVPVRIGQ